MGNRKIDKDRKKGWSYGISGCINFKCEHIYSGPGTDRAAGDRGADCGYGFGGYFRTVYGVEY